MEQPASHLVTVQEVISVVEAYSGGSTLTSILTGLLEAGFESSMRDLLRRSGYHLERRRFDSDLHGRDALLSGLRALLPRSAAVTQSAPPVASADARHATGPRPNTIPPATAPLREPCFHFAAGHCRNGSRCRYAHEHQTSSVGTVNTHRARFATHCADPFSTEGGPEARQALRNTAVGSSHFVDFCCALCHTVQVQAHDVHRINHNRVWTHRPLRVVRREGEPPSEYLHKVTGDGQHGASGATVYCGVCGVRLGVYFATLHDGQHLTRLVYHDKQGRSRMYMRPVKGLTLRDALARHQILEDQSGGASKQLTERRLLGEAEMLPTPAAVEQVRLQLEDHQQYAVATALFKKAEQLRREKAEAERQASELRLRIEEAEENLKCDICMTRRKDVVLECGHILCGVCAAQVQNCPMCRRVISTRTKMFP